MTLRLKSKLTLLFTLLCSLAAMPVAQAATRDFPTDLVGLNFSGAGFAPHVLPGKPGTNYFFPDAGHYRRWAAKGIRVIRFPVIWERLQPTLGQPLDPAYAKLIDQTLDNAKRYRMSVILDLHNYMRYRGQVIGSAAVPYSAYADVLRRIAQRWHEHPALAAYDIMNEPHDAVEQWPVAAQHGIDAVREVDRARPLLIEGNGWSSSYLWPRYNAKLLGLKDPADNLIYSAHVYFDNDGGGKYLKKDMTDFDPDVGIRRVEPFITWLKQHGKRGHIGEFGVPDNDPRWLAAMDRLLARLRQECIPAMYWAAGPNWGDYPLAIEPVKGKPRPQWKVLQKYVKPADCQTLGPR
ncbi:glycoside hydrolase family 5 protein [Pseudomonas oryzihabitans]|uniref:glycoside hydrolase family 5 protein n=1 Tax=Pseudomonas oryzihabitans TaxID=47885 RepID=UPI0011A3357D|nr:glycoside hydrolase family 5 protein [Pseudomonas oryzihabitans]